MSRYLVFIGLVLLVFGCTSRKLMQEEGVEQLTVELPPPPPPTPDITELPTDTLIWYRRTACFGQCPSFDFYVQRDGKAFYKGRNFVDLIGTYQGMADLKAVQQVIHTSDELGYQDLEEKYDNQFMSDLPSTQTIILGKKLVNRYQGPDLRKLYNGIDSVIAKIDWRPYTEE